MDDLDLAFGYGTVKVVVNTKGREGNISPELKEIIRYLDDGTVGGVYSRELEEAVNGVKDSEERRREYMVMMAREMEIRQDGIEEGRAEGRAEGTLRTLCTLVKDGILTAADAAARMDMSVSEFEARAAALGL